MSSKLLGKGNRNLLEILEYHAKSKRFIGGLCKLEKDGSVTRINGQVFNVKSTKNGSAIMLVDNFLGKRRAGAKKRWQAVLVKNVLKLTENHWKHEKVE